MMVPSLEQKQSGSSHTDKSHGSAAFGSFSTSHQPSSEPSAQSTEPSQKYSFGRQVPSPQPSCDRSSHWAASSRGLGTRAFIYGIRTLLKLTFFLGLKQHPGTVGVVQKASAYISLDSL
uniref:(northern house mosquito) hypothetical protein n=1 Tax=Culex pipiens TaxID=7175 RepID=A0A8D8CAD6_CULPI